MRVWTTVTVIIILSLLTHMYSIAGGKLSDTLKLLRSPFDEYVVHHWPDPVNVRNGNLVLYYQDIHIPYMGVSLDVARVYNSMSSLIGSFGHGWIASFDMKILKVTSDSLEILETDGSTTVYQKESRVDTITKYISSTGGSRVEHNSSKDTFTRFLGCARQHVFNGDGILIAVIDEHGNGVKFEWAQDRLKRIGDGAGRYVELTHNRKGLVETIEDPAGRVTVYEYDGSGNLAKAVAPGGISYKFKYGDHNRLEEIFYPDGGVTKIQYDDLGRVVSEQGPGRKRTTYFYEIASKEQSKQVSVVTDSLGNRTEYIYKTIPTGVNLVIKDALGCVTTKEYDSQGNLVSATDAKGSRTVYQYDEQSRLVKVVDASGSKMERTFSGSCGEDDLASITDLNGNTTSYGEDARASMSFMMDPLGFKTQFGFDNHGMMVRSVDQLGNETKFKRDRFGNISAIQDAAGRITTMDYDILGRVVAVRDPNGSVTHFLYDTQGKLYKIKSSTKQEIERNYDAAGRPVKLVDSRGFARQYIYNKEGFLDREIDQGGHEVRYERDANGNILQLIDANGNQTKFQYDALNRLTAMINPEGGITRWTYDEVGNVTALTDPAGHTNVRKYDHRGRVVQILNAAGQATELKRNLKGSTLEVTSPGNRLSITEFDKLYRPIRITEPSGDTWRFKWNPIGLLINLTDPSGKTTELTRNSTGQVTKRTDSSGRVRSLSYDETGLLAQAVMEDGTIEQYSRDKAGQIVRKAFFEPGKKNPSLVWSYEYDPAGNLTRIGNGVRPLSFRYDALGNLIEVKDSDLKAVIGSGYNSNRMRTSLRYNDKLSFTYEYDAVGRLVSLTNEWNERFRFKYYPNGLRSKLIYPNGVTATYRYDKLGNCTEITYMNPSGVLLGSYSYYYDEVGHVTKSKENDVTTQYQYDDKGRLVKVFDGNKTQAEFVYDNNGNIIRASSDEKDVKEISYNRDNQLLKWGSESFRYDQRGRLVEIKGPKGINRLTYNPLGLLKRLELPNGRAVDFQYDPLNRRTMKRSSKGVRYYVYAGVDLTWELNEEKKPVVVYTHGPRVDEPLAVRKDGKSYFLHADTLGSVRLVTDAEAKPQEKFSYKPYGSMSSKDLGEGGPFRYTGRYLDRESGLYYYRSRYYHPTVGRFITRDLIGYMSGDHNHYAYARNNPVNYTDPFGAKPRKKSGASDDELARQATSFIIDDLIHGGMQKLHEFGERHGIHQFFEGSSEPAAKLNGGVLNQHVQVKAKSPEKGIVDVTISRSESILPTGAYVNVEAELADPDFQSGRGWKAKAGKITASEDSVAISGPVGPMSVQTAVDKNGNGRVSVRVGTGIGPTPPANKFRPVGEPTRIRIDVRPSIREIEDLPPFMRRARDVLARTSERVRKEREKIRKAQDHIISQEAAMSDLGRWVSPDCVR